MAIRFEREQVLAFRLHRHNLARRLPPGALGEAAGACGLQNTPPGSAALALNARVDAFSTAEFDRAVAVEKSLVQVRSLRTAPYFCPTPDLPAFTLGVRPDDEASLRAFIPGAVPALDRVGIGGLELGERTARALLDALDGREVAFRPLSAELSERVARTLSPSQLEGWRAESWYAPGLSLGEALVHFALYVVALDGLFCFAPRRGNEATFVRLDQWLDHPLPRMAPAEARAELLRRYLRCYAPTTADRFANWAGIAPAVAARTWASLEPELAAVEDEHGRRAWVREADLAALQSPPRTTGARLLPPHDPYLDQRDRGTLLPDLVRQRLVWRTTGSPGVVLVDGRIAGLWRPRKNGRRLTVSVEPFDALTAQAREAVAAEAELLAPLRGCAAAETLFAAG